MLEIEAGKQFWKIMLDINAGNYRSKFMLEINADVTLADAGFHGETL